MIMMTQQKLDHVSLLNIDEVGEYLNMNKRTLYSYVQKGIIPHIRLGKGKKGPIRFDINHIDKWIDANTNNYVE